MPTKKTVSELVHQYEQRAKVTREIHIQQSEYEKLPPQNLEALKRLLKKGYTVQLTLN